MATRDTDLSSLRIDRASPPSGFSRKSRWLRKLLVWTVVIATVGGGFFLLKDYFDPGLEVQLVTASLTSPAQANAVLTASGYVVARRKAAVASKGTGTLVFLGVEEGDQVKKGQVIARLEDSDVSASLQRAKENLRVAEPVAHRSRRALGELVERRRLETAGKQVERCLHEGLELRLMRERIQVLSRSGTAIASVQCQGRVDTVR